MARGSREVQDVRWDIKDWVTHDGTRLRDVHHDKDKDINPGMYPVCAALSTCREELWWLLDMLAGVDRIREREDAPRPSFSLKLERGWRCFEP